MNESALNEFEELSDMIANPPSSEAYQKANESLCIFTNDFSNFDKIFEILEMSK